MEHDHEEHHGVVLDEVVSAFDGRWISRAVTASAVAGTVTAVTGASGSGKSTLLRVIGGLERPAAGAVIVDGTRVDELRGRARRRYLRESVGFVFQDAGLVEQWSARRNVRAAVQARCSAPRGKPLDLEDAARALAIDPVLDTAAHALSGGERIRVAFARLLVRKPALVLADEPTAALDLHNATIVKSFLRSLADEGATVLVATHDAALIDAADGSIPVGPLITDARTTPRPDGMPG
jgi:putative ABC transport system ATP-binding protein